ncbi:hypothetical protein BH23ACT10_BH23ACT10_09230 [soil metagenome]
MIRLGRLIAVALLLTALIPGVAFAGESDDNPLAGLPDQYEPAVDAAASQLGVSAEELTSASRDELESLLCSKLDESSVEEIAAGAKEALADAPDKDLEKLSADQRAQLEARLPSMIRELEAEYCATSNTVDDDDDAAADGSSDSDSDSDATSESGIPVPNRVDTGGGGAADGPLVPLAFGALFAGLFGLFGVGVTRRQTTS